MIFNTVIAEKDGKPFRGYLALPRRGGSRTGLILKHEVYGVNEGLKATADKFAAEGFVVLCPNMYFENNPDASFDYPRAGQPATPEITLQREAAYREMHVFTRPAGDFFEAVNRRQVDNVRLAADYLRSHPVCNGTVVDAGFCFGARATWLALSSGADVDAGVAFYPTPELRKVFTQAAAMEIRKPLLFVVGGADPYISVEEKGAMLAVAGRSYTYVAGRPAPIYEENANGNPNITTLYYASNDHGWLREGGKHFDAGTAAHTIGVSSMFMHCARSGEAARALHGPAMEMPQSPIYQPPRPQ